MPFPYVAILQKAFVLTRNNLQIWPLGVFSGLTAALNILLLSFVVSRQEWGGGEFRNPWIVANVAAAVIMAVFSAIAKAGLIEGATKLADGQKFGLLLLLREGRRFAPQVLWLRILLGSAMIGLAMMVSFPVVYFIWLQEIGRTMALAVLGLAIFVPASILLGLIFIYSPIFAGLYRSRTLSSLSLAFSLATIKLKESIIFVGLMAALTLGFLIVVSFGIIVIGVPVAFLSLVLVKLGLEWAIYLLIFCTGLATLFAFVILLAGFTVFNSLAWVFVVQELVKTEKTDEAVKILAPEAGTA